MAKKRLMSAEDMVSSVKNMAAIARRIANKIAAENGEENDFAEGAASAMEQLVEVLEDPYGAEEIPAAEAAPDH